MSVFLSPIGGASEQFFTDQGVVLAGGLLYTYEAGTTTPQATFTDSTGLTANPNPIVLNSSGRAPNEIWLQGGQTYKFVIETSNNVTVTPGTWDNIAGINDTSASSGSSSEWLAIAGTLTYISATQFTISGNQTGTFTSQRRIQAVVGAGTIYGTIASSVFTTLTTVTVVWDSGQLDSGLSAVLVSLLTSTNASIPGQFAYFVNVKDPRFGAVGDNVTDDAPAFQAAIAYCESTGMKMYIPEGNYLFGSQITITSPFDIDSADTATMRWNNSSSCGILLNFVSSTAALATMNFPQLYSPAINSSFSIPGYGPSSYTYNLASRVGNAIQLNGGNRLNINLLYASGWNAAIQVGATPTVSVDNININVNTIDFCVYGIATYTATAGSLDIAALVFTANTVWAKYPIYIDGSNQNLVASQFHITGQSFTNEVDGSTIYGYNINNTCDTCKFTVNWASSGYAADSTSGTPTTLINPFLAGTATSNGALTDGNATLGYWNGQFCEFEIGPVMAYGGGKPGASPIPTAGDTIRIRDAGAYNKITMRYSDAVNTSPIPVSTTEGESNYNGGVGGAQYSKRVFCSAAVPILTAGSGSSYFYAYHQLISVGSIKQVSLEPFDGSLATQGLLMWAESNDGTNNREIKIQFANPKTTSSTATTVYFWLVIN